LSHIPGGNIAAAYFTPQLQLELEFDTDKVIFRHVDAKQAHYPDPGTDACIYPHF
jgi:hypothetical protein